VLVIVPWLAAPTCGDMRGPRRSIRPPPAGSLSTLRELVRGEVGHQHSGAQLGQLQCESARPGTDLQDPAVVATWLAARPKAWLDGVHTVAIDPHRGYANGVAEALAHATLVVDPFHVVRLANMAIDDVRRRVQGTSWTTVAARAIRSSASGCCCCSSVGRSGTAGRCRGGGTPSPGPRKGAGA